ncbi:hypothetical protein M404DRAFT_1007050 [Pisolithus tinctorius Marx 270]|uniref:Uncharacterized protein n=1 Tax=Pisolithus tinctorius Marx 270 TaxID=870435 RepID=A0A0C3NK18_PISTI|nr:hypothetical protein M404DRAFT_1007050 [Pisolithus tinctorius Marx 270]
MMPFVGYAMPLSYGSVGQGKDRKECGISLTTSASILRMVLPEGVLVLWSKKLLRDVSLWCMFCIAFAIG